jgi:glycolate oxidase FAD binding subunit
MSEEILQPGTAGEMAEALRAAAAAGTPVKLGGAFTKDHWGGPLPRAARKISTSALNRVLQYEPKDLTISVEAGMPFRALQSLLAANGQMLPLDPAGDEQMTVGGALAVNSSGPLRRQFGTARDHVIGMSFATVEGKVVKTGGMVVKNVAGLDMQKLMIGSYGTLAAMTSVNFKVMPRPAGYRTLVFPGGAAAEVFEERNRLLAGVVQPVALDALNAAAAAACGLETKPALIARFSGNEAVLQRCAREMPQARPAGEDLWNRIAALRNEAGRAVARLSSRLSEMAKLMDSLPGLVVARAGSGVTYAIADPGQLSAALEGRAGAVIESAPAEAKGRLNLWPAPGDGFPVMQRLKLLFDPQATLNPGRLHGRL